MNHESVHLPAGCIVGVRVSMLLSQQSHMQIISKGTCGHVRVPHHLKRSRPSVHSPTSRTPAPMTLSGCIAQYLPCACAANTRAQHADWLQAMCAGTGMEPGTRHATDRNHSYSITVFNCTQLRGVSSSGSWKEQGRKVCASPNQAARRRDINPCKHRSQQHSCPLPLFAKHKQPGDAAVPS